MKNLYLNLMGVIMAMLAFSACTDEAEVLTPNENPQDHSSLCTFILPEVPVHGIGESSRTAISIENDKLKFVWAEGDRIGILPDEGSQVYFTIDAQTAGDNHASFDGGAWALKANHQYDAYFPFIEDIMLDRMAVPVDYTNQKQTGNNSMAHLGSHDYLAAKGTTNDNGGVNYTFQRMNSVGILKFTAPDVGMVLKSVTLSADEAVFTTKGKLDMDDLTIKDMEKSASLTVGVDYTTQATDEEVTVYFMCYPDQLEGKSLNVAVVYEGATEPLYLKTDGMNMVAGDGYILATPPIPYLTFSANAEQAMTMKEVRYKMDESIEYSVGGGAWQPFVVATQGETGQTTTYQSITFGGDNGTLRMRGKSSKGMGTNGNDKAWITFGNSNVMVSCTGDIRTLVDYTNYRNASTSEARFSALFGGCTNLISAPELPATTLASYCYEFMFYGCTGLTTAPVLPATTLAEECYRSMFYGCTGLTTAPELPAETLAERCYYEMFYGCTGLTTAPALPAETLADDCYSAMFQGCTGLTTAPALPAETLADGCYSAMFQGCTGLTIAPALPAETLADYCYSSMFRGCSGLNSITMLATNISASYCLYDWVSGVSATGTFYKNSAATWDNTGTSGIPSEWTVMNYTESN